MIEFHEDEYIPMVSGRTLRAIASLFGKETANKLLYRGSAYVGLDHHNSRCVVEVWRDSNGFRDGFVRSIEDEDVQAKDEAILPVPLSG